MNQAAGDVAIETASALAEPERGSHSSRRRIRRWIVTLAGVAVLGPFLFLLGSGLGTDPSLVRSPLLGKPAPAFDLPRIDSSGRMSSAELTGRLYVVNFWASWCVPCREETPALEEFSQRWRPQGVELVGVLYSDTLGAARQFRTAFGGSWPLVDDPQGRAAIDYGVFGVPETFVVDRRGVIMAKLVGRVSPGTLDDIIGRIERGSGPVLSQNDQYRRAP